MEEKLKAAANQLPLPTTDFLAVEERSKASDRISRIRRRWIPVLLTILILMTGCTIAAATTEVNHSAWVDPIVHGWGAVKQELKKVDYTLPKTLGEAPFSQSEFMYFCPPGTSWLGAILNPSYKPTIVTYGSRDSTEMELMFGSTLNKYCHQWWELEEDYEPWFMRHENLLEGTGERLEYEDNILYTGTLVYKGGMATYYDAEGNPTTKVFDDRYKRCVLWVDTQRNLACCLASEEVEADTLLQYAKEIIDLNQES